MSQGEKAATSVRMTVMPSATTPRTCVAAAAVNRACILLLQARPIMLEEQQHGNMGQSAKGEPVEPLQAAPTSTS